MKSVVALLSLKWFPSFKSVGFFLAAAFCVAGMNGVAQAQPLMTESFSYSTGQLTSASGGANVSGGAWVSFSGTANFIQVSNGSLSYPFYPHSGIGNKIDIVATTASGEDAHRQFATQGTGTTTYAAFLVNVANTTLLPLNSSTTGEYFAGFLPSTSTTLLVARVSIRLGSVASTYQLGLRATSANGATSFSTTDLSPGTTYLVVISYQVVAGNTNDPVNMWINPALGGSQPAPTLSQTTASATDNVDVARFFVRQGTAAAVSTPNASIDGIRVGPTWESVTATTAIKSETEPNDTSATAQALGATPVRVRGDLFRAPFSLGVDVDVYSFTAAAGDRVYAATMTGFSAGSEDTELDILDTNGTTLLETDDEDGTIGGSASNIAGLTLASAGTYYVRVRQFSTGSLTGTIRPYDLYVRVLSGTPTPETEPNNNGGGGPQVLAANGWMSGTIDPAADNDTYSVSANAGDTIVAILDVDPERDSPEWDARVAIGLFNSFFLVANGSAVGGAFDDANPSEAFFMTVKTTGTYVIYIDEAFAGGAAADTYTLSVSVIPGNNARSCTTYTGGTTGAIADLATTDFTLSIPDSRIVDALQLSVSATHAATADLDVSLISPDGNEVVLFVDPPTGGGAAPQIDFTIDDEAAIPVSIFSIHSGMKYTPDFFARMAYFKGMQAQGTWTLRVRDDLAANAGTLNSWSLTVCNDPFGVCSVAETTVFTNDFETNDGGFTHSGTQDEWARGLPSGASAPITTCHSGTNCWKTDLTGTYNASSNQELLSPNIDLTGLTGTFTLSWWQKYQFESASFDSAWVEVREVGVPASARRVWEWKGATQAATVGNPATTVQMSAGWGLVKADVSDFANKNIEVRYHLESDSLDQFSGWAVDDVTVSRCAGPTAAPATIGGRITTPDGSPLGGAVMRLSGSGTRTTMSDGAGNYHFDDLETGNFYTVTPELANYQFSPGSRSFSLTGNMTDAGFTANPDASQSANAIDTIEYFVRQQYLDFLGREPDQGGLEYWSSQFDVCNGDATCIRNKRIDVSAAFFASVEFQQTGSYIYGLYAGTLGRTPAYGEFMPDRAQVVGGSGLDPAKTAFAQSFVQRSEFIARYPGSMSREQFVDAVIQTMTQRSGVDQSSLRSELLDDYDNDGRALVVRHAAEADSFVSAEYNKAFVLMEYFGYLRRDVDPGGYAFWLDVLNNGTPGNYRGMVCAFLTSAEYQHRFSSVVTHSNAECGQ